MLWKMFAALKPTYPTMSVTQLHMACQLVKPCTRNQKEIIFPWPMPCSLVGSIYVLEKIVTELCDITSYKLLPSYPQS